ncbi:MAG: YaeQ family protein [Gammaproteobacteria bacterium]|nr:YaeQ family protein [Gammaproteobacteria bacterium]
MALKSTVFKLDLQISDLDRHYYQTHQLTLARHPSETNARMLMRIVAFALHASDALSFTKGLSTDDEPDIWEKNLTNEILLWIDLGQPDEKRIRQACGKAKSVIIYTYNQRSSAIWWSQIEPRLKRFRNLSVINLSVADSDELEAMVDRNIELQCTLQDGQVWLSNNALTLAIEKKIWKDPSS